MAVMIKSVEPGSPALGGGMRLLAIDGHPIADGLDYEFYQSGADLELLLSDGQRQWQVKAPKEEYEPLGCEFESYLITPQHHCKNKCLFCFVDQLPPGMRPSLYFKDDDERLGFLFGNYITLTNLTQSEVERIIAMRFSPVNISVHTADPELRVRLMGNPGAGRALGYIPRLAKAGIEMNFQLVLLPGLNDGEALRRSIRWLAGFAPATRSIAAVPVGLTRHREGLPALAPYTPEEAARQLRIMLEEGERLLAGGGRRMVYPSDEWFLLAGREIPGADFYEDYPQLENGVGMWRLFCDEFMEALEDYGPGTPPAEADIVTGSLAAPLMRKLAAALAEKLPGSALHVHEVKNNFFGPGVTVTGLLTGGDIVAQLKGRLRSGSLLLPRDTLRAEGDALLDDMRPEDIAKALGVRVQVAPLGAAGLLEVLCSDDSSREDALL